MSLDKDNTKVKPTAKIRSKLHHLVHTVGIDLAGGNSRTTVRSLTEDELRLVNKRPALGNVNVP